MFPCSIFSLLLWKEPALTQQLFSALCGAFVVSCFLPLQTFIKLVGEYIMLFLFFQCCILLDANEKKCIMNSTCTWLYNIIFILSWRSPTHHVYCGIWYNPSSSQRCTWAWSSSSSSSSTWHSRAWSRSTIPSQTCGWVFQLTKKSRLQKAPRSLPRCEIHVNNCYPFIT